MRKKKSNDVYNENTKKNRKPIYFEDYAPLKKDYTQQELVEIYKRLIMDIEKGKI